MFCFSVSAKTQVQGPNDLFFCSKLCSGMYMSRISAVAKKDDETPVCSVCLSKFSTGKTDVLSFSLCPKVVDAEQIFCFSVQNNGFAKAMFCLPCPLLKPR